MSLLPSKYGINSHSLKFVVHLQRRWFPRDMSSGLFKADSAL